MRHHESDEGDWPSCRRRGPAQQRHGHDRQDPHRTASTSRRSSSRIPTSSSPADRASHRCRRSRATTD
ncbi:hypothetical protein ACFPRL_07230 [Pseudoclavibacter helvolus]